MNFDINNITPDTDYLDIINNIFYQKKISNQRLSLRGFARLLKITPSQLSQIMSGKCGLSKANAVKISRCLGFTQQETEVFTHLVLIKHARSQKTKKVSEDFIRKMKGFFSYVEDTQALNLVNSWMPLVVLEYFDLMGESFNVLDVAKRLAVEPSIIESTIDILLKEKCIKKTESGYLKTLEPYIVSKKEPALKQFFTYYQSILDREKQIINSDQSKRKYVFNSAVAVSKADLDYLEVEMRNFFKKMLEDVSAQKKSKEDIYFLTVSMISPEFKI